MSCKLHDVHDPQSANVITSYSIHYTKLYELADLCRQYGNDHPLAVRFEVVGGVPPLPARIEAGLYRVAQEALTNVVRHAQAGHALVQLVALPGKTKLIISDDGRGFA